MLLQKISIIFTWGTKHFLDFTLSFSHYQNCHISHRRILNEIFITQDLIILKIKKLLYVTH